MRFGSTAIVCILCVAWQSLVFARTYVVSPGGNDNNAGSIAAPWRTLAKANAALTAGDTVLVRGGLYHERIVPARSGSSGSPIVYRSFPGESVVVDGPDDTDLNLVTVAGSWVSIEGFTFRNQDYFDVPGDKEYWVVLWGTHNVFRYNRLIADGDVFENIFVRNARSRGIAESGQYNTIEHCFVRGVDFGIVVSGPAPRYAVLRYDTVHATGANNINVCASGSGAIAYHSTLIEYCVMDTSFTEDNIQFEPDYGDPKSTLHNRGTIIRRSVMGNAAENAIDLKGAGHTIIEENLIYSSSGDDDGPIGGHDVGSGGGVTANANTPTRNTIVRKNVIWDHATGLDMAEGDHYFNNTLLNNRRTWQGPNQPGASHVALRAFNYPNTKRAFLNNVVAGQANGAVYDWMMDWGGKFHLDNNVYFDVGTPVRFTHRKNGAVITTAGLNSWKNELATYAGYAYMQGKDVSALEVDPQFVNAPIAAAGYDPAWNFGLRSSSPAVDAGRFVTNATTEGKGSTTLSVDDAYFFCDGFGIIGGDSIRIGGGAAVRIQAIDYDRNVLTLSEPRDWSAGSGVHLAYRGGAPDIGAVETGTSAVVDPDTLPPPPGMVQLSTPADGARDLLLTPTLSWVPVSNALSYHLQVSLTSGFGNTSLDKDSITTTSYAPASLTAGTTYFWRVRGANRGGSGPWSVQRSFTTAVADTTKPDTLPPPPTIIQLNTPGDGARDVALQSSLVWTSAPTALSYHVQVSLTSGFGSRSIDEDSITNTLLPLASLAGNTTYFWRVRGANRGGFGPWSTVRSFTTEAVTGGTGKEGTQLLANGGFENGAQGWTFFTNGTGGFSTTGPGFTGSLAGHITILSTGDNIQLYQGGIVLVANAYYRLTFSAYSSTGHDLAVGLMKHGTPFTNYGLLTRTVGLDVGWRTHNVYLRATNFAGTVTDARLQFWLPAFARGGDEYWFDDVSIQQIDAPPALETPRAVSPAPGAADQPCLTTLTWTSVDGADAYLVQLATDSLFAHLVCDSVVTDTQMVVGPLESATRYYKRIRAVNVGGPGQFSQVSYFTTLVGKTGPDRNLNLPVQVYLEQNYPNPFNPSTIIQFHIPAQAYVTLNVYNALGEEVALLADGERKAGVHVVHFSAEGMPSGSYFYTLRVDGMVETRKMTMLH